MRELHVIEDNGLFGITFKSDNKEEANTVMNAIQRFISKVSNNEEIKENINDNSKSSVKDYSRCPIDGPSKDVYLYLFSNIKLIELYNNDELEQGYKDYIKNELNKRGIFDLSMTKSKKKSRELENKITHGRRLSELTIDELKELEKVTMNDHFKEDIQKEIDKRENKYFEDYMRENKEIISFGEDDEESSYKIDEEDAEDPLSLGDENNLNRWDYDADGDKVDIEGNKFLFED